MTSGEPGVILSAAKDLRAADVRDLRIEVRRSLRTICAHQNN